MKFKSDIDVDVANRETALKLLKHIPASIRKDNQFARHNTGAYFTEIPRDPITGQSSLDYKEAEERGYIKLDILNVNLYQQIKSEQHLENLMNLDPAWDSLYDKNFCSQLIHIGAHYDTLIKMPEAVNTIPRLAMFLAVIRPAKRHLVGLPWTEVARSVWERPEDDAYYFKKSHSISYAHLIVVHMNLLTQSSLPT